MCQLLGLAYLCFTLSIQTAAQANASPMLSTRARFTLSDIDERAVKQFDLAWRQCARGTKPFEAVVLILRESDGSTKALLAGSSNQSYEFSFRWDPAIIAIAHTHPNNRNPRPQEQDILVANKFAVPVLTITSFGMFMFDPATHQISKIYDDTEWLDASSWARKFHWEALGRTVRPTAQDKMSQPVVSKKK